MNIFRRMGKLTKAILILIIVGSVSYFGWKHFNKFDMGNINGGSDNTVTMALNGWAGFAGITWVNGGMITTENSLMKTKFDGNLSIIQTDIRRDAINGLKNGDVDVIWGTVDVLPIEMGEMNDMVQLNVVCPFKIDDSHGADVVLARDYIKSVADFKGKRVVFGRGTASHSLLLNTLESGGLTMNDIIAVEVDDGIGAVKAFINGEADVAVVWSPDDGDCIDAVPGTWKVTSTQYATSIIMDCLLVKKETLDNEKKFNEIVKVCKAWLYANGQLNSSDAIKEEAAAIFVQSFEGTNAFVVLDGINKVRFSTYGDNKAFFGLDPTYTGVTGNDLYTRMARTYSQTKDNSGSYLATNPISWVKIYDTRVIDAITDMNTPDQVIEGKIQFERKENLESAPIVSGKAVTVNFDVNSFTLDEYNRSVVDREIGKLANSFGGARFRIEGNTDNTGNSKSNKNLSYQRAQSIVKFLVDKYGFDSDRFVVVGNGEDNPIADNSTEVGKAANRRTDVFIIRED